MDYCIYKTVNGGKPRVIHTFTQEATFHRAKNKAKQKLSDMWLRICTKPDTYRNACGDPTEFSYDYQNTAGPPDHIRFYIAPMQKKANK